MALWDRFRKRDEQQPDQAPEGQETSAVELAQELEQEEVKPLYKEDKKRFVQECCESIGENEKQIQIARKEYEQVTEYLTDIQKIDRIEGEDQTLLQDTAQKLQVLMKERSLYKNRNLTISEAQIRRFDRYEEELVDEIKKMYQIQTHQKAVVSDMKHLEEEKARLYGDRKEIVEKQDALKGMAKILCALIFSMVLLFVALYYALSVDMTLPYLATLLLAAISATVIFLEANKNRRDMVMTERKLTKAITLLNRVKIKYVNNSSLLEYDREKYGVKDAADFEEIWTEYRRAKEYERKFRENTEQMHRCNEDLTELLKKHEVADPEIWLSQTLGLLDKREMVEIRHELNQRRQKLRERIAYNTDLKQSLLAQVDGLIQENPGMREELLEIVQKFKQAHGE